MEYYNLTGFDMDGAPSMGAAYIDDDGRIKIQVTENNTVQHYLLQDAEHNKVLIVTDSVMDRARCYKKTRFISVREYNLLSTTEQQLNSIEERLDAILAQSRARQGEKSDFAFLKMDYHEAIGELCLDFIAKYGFQLSIVQQQIAGHLFRQKVSQEDVVQMLFDLKLRDKVFIDLFNRTLRKNDG